MKVAISLTFAACAFLPAIAAGQNSSVEKYVASIRSVDQVKQGVRAALTAECATGSCVNNNATETCTLVGALDARVGNLITASDPKQTGKPEIPISAADVQIFKRIWARCRPTNYQFWNYSTVLHVAYEGDPKEDAEILRQLGQPSPKKPAAATPSTKAKAAPTEQAQRLSECIAPKIQYGQYSSYDGGKSARGLLEQACQGEYLAWVDSCTAAGDTQDSCIMKALTMAQVTLRHFGK